MNILSVFSFITYTTEVMISPLPAEHSVPHRSFAQLPISSPQVLSAVSTPTPLPIDTRQLTKKIALLGDSMIDTLGNGFPHLERALKEYYPFLTTTMLNYGVGATNIDYGIERITNEYTYLGKKMPSLASQQPDVVVVESFSYNPLTYDAGALDLHWLALERIVDTISKEIPRAKIVIATTIAPNSKVFADGAPGIAFSQEEKIVRVNMIKRHLESTNHFAKRRKIALADAFTLSLQSNGDGDTEYINTNDHIHMSERGKQLFADVVAKSIFESKILE